MSIFIAQQWQKNPCANVLFTLALWKNFFSNYPKYKSSVNRIMLMSWCPCHRTINRKGPTWWRLYELVWAEYTADDVLRQRLGCVLNVPVLANTAVTVWLHTSSFFIQHIKKIQSVLLVDETKLTVTGANC